MESSCVVIVVGRHSGSYRQGMTPPRDDSEVFGHVQTDSRTFTERLELARIADQRRWDRKVQLQRAAVAGTCIVALASYGVFHAVTQKSDAHVVTRVAA